MDPDIRPSSTPRKFKFAPKGPPRREAKPPESKREEAKEGDSDDGIDEALFRKVNDHLTRRQHKAQKKSLVQVAFAHGVAASTSVETYGVRKEGTGEITSSKGLSDSTLVDGLDLLSLPSRDRSDGVTENSLDPLFRKKKREYKEPWDYHHSYYPTTLPLRRPFSGDPELLDEEEFGEAASAVEYDENAKSSASDLGLLEKGEADKMLFFQLPASIPFGERPTSAGKMEAAGSIKLPRDDAAARVKGKAVGGSFTPRGTVAPLMAKGKELPGDIPRVPASREGKQRAESLKPIKQGGASKKVSCLEELPAGCIGKMLVYKSGAVKLKLGDILYDVSPGVECTFAQQIMTVNTVERQCCALGELNKRAVLTPDVDSLLDPVIHLE